MILDNIQNKKSGQKDSNNRVAVIITDGVYAIVGKTPQNFKKSFYGHCDLPKGHALIGENLVDAAKREVLEETDLNIESLTQISKPLKYLKGTTLTFFVSEMGPLPKMENLKCSSCFEWNGKEYPEIISFYTVPLKKLTNYLYHGLSKLISENNIIQRVEESLNSRTISFDDFSKMVKNHLNQK